MEIQRTSRVTLHLSKTIESSVVMDMIDDVAEEVFDTDVIQRLEEIENAEKAVQLSRVRTFWLLWKRKYTSNTKIKRAMEEFPCAPNMQSLTDQLQSLLCVEDERLIDKQFYVNKRAQLTTETPIEIDKRRKETDIYITAKKLYNDLRNHTAWQPIDIRSLVGKCLTERCTAVKSKYW